ncbi:MAG TPA: carbon-nitrogen hydrolase family protein [Burkholderiales bacterium]|nr:carbon-nitrogen hydrolase family protein [Burkholderiales bacterium]
MSDSFRIACLQMQAGNDLEANLATVRDMAGAAAARGARFILTPEYALMLDGSGRVMRERALAADGSPALPALQALARDLKVWFLAGSLTVRTEAADGRIANRSFVISDGGAVVAAYDKIHMFDVTLPDGRAIRESSAYRPGDRAVTADTPWGRFGLTVCYDLRFPGLYRALALAGSHYITVPSSFQPQTGKVHWYTLVRARAIENGCFIIAPAMCGDHPGNRQTYGHTLVVDPWGEVLADGGESPGIVYAEIDPAAVTRARGMIPSIDHDRVFSPPAD